MVLQLPYSRDCLVCGRDNTHGLRLDLYVDPDRSIVRADFVPASHHAGFDEVVHGGLIATVLDEAMTWTATWWGRRFCFCGEITARFRKPVRPGVAYRIEALVEFAKPKLIETSAKLMESSGAPAATASGKYVPMSVEEHQRFIQTMIRAPATEATLELLS
jgi:acyl-coenzyme A thioesterase PaaI-like protein